MHKKLDKNTYPAFAKKYHPPKKLFLNSLKAFIAGGTICAIGQILHIIYTYVGVSESLVDPLVVATLVLVANILTGLGIYDNLAQWGGAGTAVPVTGFANAISSAALEHRSEGYVLGVGGNMFKLAGSVIVLGVVATFIISLFYIWFT